jgi:hypothetical protein
VQQKTKIKENVNVAVKKRREGDPENEGGNPLDFSIGEILEEACGELGYSLDEIEDFLSSGDLPEELVALMMQKSGCADKAALLDALKPQRAALLGKV